jgi:hypothetical protein
VAPVTAGPQNQPMQPHTTGDQRSFPGQARPPVQAPQRSQGSVASVAGGAQNQLTQPQAIDQQARLVRIATEASQLSARNSSKRSAPDEATHAAKLTRFTPINPFTAGNLARLSGSEPDSTQPGQTRAPSEHSNSSSDPDPIRAAPRRRRAPNDSGTTIAEAPNTTRGNQSGDNSGSATQASSHERRGSSVAVEVLESMRLGQPAATQALASGTQPRRNLRSSHKS